MAKRGTNALSDLSVADIQRELRRRAKRATSLRRRRNSLLAKLAKLDSQIGLAEGAGAGRLGYTPRKRAKNSMSLVQALAQTLKGKTMGVTEVASAVQHGGYKTTAANFRTIVNQALLKHRKQFRKVSRGQYTAT